MNDLESTLKSARLAAPSANLDHRIEALFAAGASRRSHRFWPRWFGTAVALGGAAVVLVLSLRRAASVEEPERVVVRHLAPDDPVCALLQEPASAVPAPPIIMLASTP